MKLKVTSAAVAAALATLALPMGSVHAGVSPVKSVEFIGMPIPSTAEEKADLYTKAQVKITRRNGETETHNLKYHQVMATTEKVNGSLVGGLYDTNGNALADSEGPMASDAADGTSLLRIPGLKAANRGRSNPLAMVVNFEYKELPPKDGVSSGSFWSKLPASTGFARLDQDKKTGALQATDYQTVNFNPVHGGWIHCGSTRSAWNTHISSEEYEPDAKTREGLPKATDSDDATNIESFSKYYFGDPATAKPYHYGLLPEITVRKDGKTQVVKHYAPGRYAREMQEFAADDRTSIGGDDGKNTGLFMFVADKPKNLSAGTLYAAKVKQTRADNGGSYTLEWINLGHGNDTDIKALVDSGIKFSDIFEFLPADTKADTTGYTKVVTYMGTEWLKLKPGKEQAAAFLETRRYAALLGATTEFSKMEYIAYNKKDRKFYLTISRVEAGMSDGKGDIQIARNDGGIILEMSTAKGQKDTQGNPIRSAFAGTTLESIPELVGGWRADGTRDSEGNACVHDKLCGPDNLRYVDAIRTLFLGEDTSRRNNNYVWAFNIDTRQLSRILSVPMNAEATGLTIETNYNGFGYILGNIQHPAEDRGTPYGTNPLSNYKGSDKAAVLDALNAKWNHGKKAAVGYIGTEQGALPALK